MWNRQQIVELDKTFVWHPYTAMDVYVEQVDPLVIYRAQGSFLFDINGRQYIDANASWWLSTLGHNHPRLVAALQRQSQELCHVSLAGTIHPQAALLAEELVAAAPKGLTRVFYSDDGSTAVEVAIKMAAQYFAQHRTANRKRRFLALEGAFHGETVGASSLGGVEVFRRPFASVLFDCIRVPSPADEAGFELAFAALKNLVEANQGDIAAIVIEPLVQGAAGMQLYDAKYLVALRELCDRCEVLLIADEVFTGYGRTGRMWACDHAAITPDIMCVGKGFTGGVLPMAATLTTDKVFQGFFGGRSRAFLYGHSYCGNPLGAAVAREVLAIFREENILEQAARNADRIAQAMREMAGLPGVRRARSLGVIGAFDLELEAKPSPRRETVESESDVDGGGGYLGDAGWRVYEAALRRGAYVRPLGQTIYLCPPLNTPPEVLDVLLSIIRESVSEVAAG